MRHPCGYLCLFVSFLFCIAHPSFADTPRAERVIVVANRNEPHSLELARYYQSRRAIPERNIILIETSSLETISWAEFVDTLLNPLRERLIDEGWIEAVMSKDIDADGRRRDIPFGHRIAYLVMCYGLPLRISEDALPSEAAQPRSAYRIHRAAVDSELALMAHPAYSRAFAVQNPLFRKLDPPATALNKVIKIARLDGPDLASACGLVEGALMAEANGLRGRAYVDLGGPHVEGDNWLAATSELLEALSFDVQVEKSCKLIPLSERFDAPALYFGWWKPHIQGAVSRNNLRFPPGALAFHIHSFSARTVRSRTQAWVGPFIARGVAATVGNVYEPYLHFSHHLHLLLEALAKGKTLGDAAFYSLPALSWQAVLIGDPLYRPFAVPLEAQIKDLEDSTSRLGAYVVLRRMRLLQAEGRCEEALEAGRRGFLQHPGLALAYALAKAYLDDGQREQALQTLSFTKKLTIFTTETVPIAKAIADVMAEAYQKAEALDLYRRFLSVPELPEAMKRAYLIDGIALAGMAGDVSLQQAWTSQLSQLSSGEVSH